MQNIQDLPHLLLVRACCCYACLPLSYGRDRRHPTKDYCTHTGPNTAEALLAIGQNDRDAPLCDEHTADRKFGLWLHAPHANPALMKKSGCIA